MGQLFIRHTDGLFDVTRKIHIDSDEENEIMKILEAHGLKGELMELQDYDTPTFSVGGYCYYLNEIVLFEQIMNELKGLLLKNKDRKSKFKSWTRS